ncbi:group I truncated hemoglobin [Xanthomonas campestris]|uniref:group I truncated hemoglobin n=1 Tax=Xanthomonas campestris TaxID=339 RepID=UPI002367ECCB|nr:group 1 truncated hemoglobin [Xanthomonas campestris]MEA9730540.1 group 1 truncated hemoglobin [Xanthomonas campestris]WDJ83773.1 group 1 truncated hemoglobin [Xanthomonas campestris pv. incanae]WDK27130.1 group 1 truncated hemoglobin [Xanthomonas campestris pv. incanae]
MTRWLRYSLCVLMLSACATTQPRQTLYEELGGQPGIEALVETMLSRIADDPRIVEHFARVNIVMLNERLVQKFCHVADGPCPDTAKSMAQAHQHMAIREGDFNALVEDLNWAMDQRNIPRRTQNRLLARLAAMHGEIVNH